MGSPLCYRHGQERVRPHQEREFSCTSSASGTSTSSGTLASWRQLRALLPDTSARGCVVRTSLEGSHQVGDIPLTSMACVLVRDVWHPLRSQPLWHQSRPCVPCNWAVEGHRVHTPLSYGLGKRVSGLNALERWRGGGGRTHRQ